MIYNIHALLWSKYVTFMLVPYWLKDPQKSEFSHFWDKNILAKNDVFNVVHGEGGGG